MVIRSTGTHRISKCLTSPVEEPILELSSTGLALGCYPNCAVPVLRSVLVGDPIRTRTETRAHDLSTKKPWSRFCSRFQISLHLTLSLSPLIALLRRGQNGRLRILFTCPPRKVRCIVLEKGNVRPIPIFPRQFPLHSRIWLCAETIRVTADAIYSNSEGRRALTRVASDQTVKSRVDVSLG